MNNVVLIGRLTRDPELRYIPNSGTAVCNFTLAVDKGLNKEKREELEAKNEPTADFIRIVVWGKMAENAAQYLAKGRLVAIQGRIQTGSYVKEGTNDRIYTFDVVASSVEFLEWGDKPQQQGGQSQQQGGYQPQQQGGYQPQQQGGYQPQQQGGYQPQQQNQPQPQQPQGGIQPQQGGMDYSDFFS